LRGIRDGQQADLEIAYRRYYGQIRGLLARMVGDEADDLAQEVFWRLYTRPPSRPDSDLRAWLHRVASRLGYNALRRRRRSQRAAQATFRAELAGGLAPGAEEMVQREAERALVRTALARLKKRDAEMLAMRYGGMSYGELAQALGVSPGSVGTLLARAERAFAAEHRRLSEPGGDR
jgi:RNA polymerase sigma-70 factor (ECF subfamily)